MDAFKISEVNEEGYSESIPAIPKMAFKGGAWEKAVVLKPEYESETTLEECYFELMSKLGYTSSYEMI